MINRNIRINKKGKKYDYSLNLPKYQDGGDFDEWYKTVPEEKSDTTNYRLRYGYENNLIPQEQLDSFVNDKNSHLYSAYEDPKTGIYEFLKSKNHKTINKELDWYNSEQGKEFKSKYDLDTSGEYYRYIPKFQNGGYTNTVYTDDPNDFKLQAYRDSTAIYESNDRLINLLESKNYKPFKGFIGLTETAKEAESIINRYENLANSNNLTEHDKIVNPKKRKNLTEIGDIVNTIVKEDLGRQLISSKILPKGLLKYKEKKLYNPDIRIGFDYSNVKPKTEVIYKPNEKNIFTDLLVENGDITKSNTPKYFANEKEYEKALDIWNQVQNGRAIDYPIHKPVFKPLKRVEIEKKLSSKTSLIQNKLSNNIDIKNKNVKPFKTTSKEDFNISKKWSNTGYTSGLSGEKREVSTNGKLNDLTNYRITDSYGDSFTITPKEYRENFKKENGGHIRVNRKGRIYDYSINKRQ